MSDSGRRGRIADAAEPVGPDEVWPDVAQPVVALPRVRIVVTYDELSPLGGGRFAVRGHSITMAFYKSDDHGGMYMDERSDASRRAVSYHRPPPPDAQYTLLDYEGAFHSPELSTRWTLRGTPDGRLLVQMPRDSAELRRAGQDVFSDGYLLVIFKRSREGRITSFVASTPRTLGVAFTRERQ